MVLQDNRSPLATSTLRIPRLEVDASRVAATSGALLLNIAALGLLLVPATVPRLVEPAAPPPIWIQRIKQTKPLPPPPPPELEVRRTPAPTQTRPAPVAPHTLPTNTQPTVIDVPFVDTTSVPNDMATADVAPQAGPDTGSGPVTGMALRYLRADAPPYPRDALRAGQQGTVLLRVLVDVDGKPLRVDIEKSSGVRTLDEAARRHVLSKWLFEPAMRNGSAVQAVGLVPIDFNLGR